MNRRAGQEVASSVTDWPARCHRKDSSMNKTNSQNPTRPEVAEQAETVTLEGDALPCGDCGVAVQTPDPAKVEKAERVRNGRATAVPIAKCPACLGRDRRSIALTDRYLRGGVTSNDRRYGGKDAVTLLVEARAAIDAAGMEPSPVESLKRPGAVLAIEVERLSRAMLGLRWRDRLSPPTSLVATPVRLVEPGTANARPWAHLNDEDRAGLRQAVVQTLVERVALQASDVALVPPTIPDGPAGRGAIPVTAGCLYCGVGSVSMTALAVARRGGADAAARSVWTLRQVNAAALGGRRSGSLLIGWLCPPCQKAAVSEGSANSAGALEDALSTFLGVSRRTMTGDELWVVGLEGWGALVANAIRRDLPLPSPNPDRWGHLTRAEREALALGWGLGGA